ncbi:hypothetical protein N7523_004622 [Penicillium sp. IBT 18751x]|nr:hypothetical protein N7523_004622 [Penicillium sp. IBT 18751x]
MRKWVQACKVLRSFRIVHGAGVVSGDDFQPRKLYNSLSLQKSTLESIWIEAHDGDMDTDDEWMGSFVDFTALKLICASLPNFVEFDDRNLPVRDLRNALPPDLETLYLSVSRDEVFNEAIVQLAELAASRSFPRLASRYLEYYLLGKPGNIGKLDWLEQKCQNAGILCIFHDSEKWVQGQKQRLGIIWPCNEASLL